jgi:glutathione S-transferase
MANTITLYSCEGTPNSIKITLTLEELGLKYATQRVDITKNEQKQPWFLEINPNGRVPALKDGDLRIFESGAIMLYLADKYDDENKISYSHGTDEYYEMLSRLMFQMGGIGPMQGRLTYTYLFHFELSNC